MTLALLQPGTLAKGVAFVVLGAVVSAWTSSALAPSAAFAAAPLARIAVVLRAIDGDTVELHGGERVRLLGIDTPETVKPVTPAQPFGKEASAFADALLAGREVTVRLDPGAPASDRYGRTLARLELRGLDVNWMLVRGGFAFAEARYRMLDRRAYCAAEREARAERRGLWAAAYDPATPSTRGCPR